MQRHNPSRKEIEIIMDQLQFVAEREGLVGLYSEPVFRKSDGIPGLQCVDAIAWVCYQYSLLVFKGIPLKKFVEESWHDFGGHLSFEGWLHAFTMRREQLKRSIERAIADGRALQFFKEWRDARGHEKAIGI